MRVKDERLWSEQFSELGADDGGLRFRGFLVSWVEVADAMLDGGGGCGLSPREALGEAFEVAEQTFGFLSVEWLGQMLLVIVQHWSDGDRLWESLSPWERRLVEQATAVKLVELQRAAAPSDSTESDC